MSTPHKYAKEIIHWANGGEIQYQNTSHHTNLWYEYEDEGGIPAFNADNLKWRIKPETLRYRVALMKTSNGACYTRTANNDEEFNRYLDSLHYVDWISDWIEVEV